MKGHLVTVDLPFSPWAKSTHSGPDGGECVEWAPSYASAAGVVPIRDSKHPTGPILTVTPHAWAGLVTLARNADL
ncbi:DUF397 domain-containing protein [Streptomyces sp. NPDC057638]|uniref:DUF397 domain-containing protein n=1 Tax=Streptomyces sp. NPDC057638 TaxID=3346190 RepID=UPI0036A9AF8F